MLGGPGVKFQAAGERFDNDVLHALALRTYTPNQWEKLGR